MSGRHGFFESGLDLAHNRTGGGRHCGRYLNRAEDVVADPVRCDMGAVHVACQFAVHVI